MIIYLEVEEKLQGDDALYKVPRKFVDIVEDEIEAYQKLNDLLSVFPHFENFEKRIHYCRNGEGEPCEFQIIE